MPDPFAHDGFRCRLAWGRHGARVAAERGDVLVVVDTLSFSTATVTAVQRGAAVYPCAWTDDPTVLARGLQAEAAVRRGDVPSLGRFSLSPPTMEAAGPDTRIVLASPNGATCSQFGRAVPELFVGTLLNAQAVADAVTAILQASEFSVTVLPCGERWKRTNEDGDLRFAVEDYLGAGAIISALGSVISRSPEATICAGAFEHARPDLAALLWECSSGQELREAGYPQDVMAAARLNACTVAPRMVDGWLQA